MSAAAPREKKEEIVKEEKENKREKGKKPKEYKKQRGNKTQAIATRNAFQEA